jgi:hypothetical protein
MKRKKLTRTAHDRLFSQVEDEAANDSSHDDALQKACADFYERRTRMWSNFTQGDFWIAIGLYAILASVAFVAL